MGERSDRGSNLDAISHTAKHGRSNVSFQEISRNGAMGERSGKRSNLAASHIWLQTREDIARQFLETSRNGAMEERSEKGSTLEPISRNQLDCHGFGC